MTGYIRYLLRFLVALALFVPVAAQAQELLLNRSFEDPLPTTPVNGNNFYPSVPGWSISNVTPAQPLPANIIRAWSGYSGNPTVTPTGGGALYFDVNSAAGTLRQTVTIPSQGMIDFSGWFSVRDSKQTLSGMIINVRDPGGTVVGTASVSFVDTEAIGLWKQGSGANIPVSAGNYTFEVIMPDPANFDLASMVFKPALALTKTSTPFSDPVNGTTNPKFLASGVAEYTITATTPASYAVSPNTILLVDPTPANTQLIVANIGGAGSGPAAFTAGSTGLTYAFTSLASTADDIEFSNNGGVSWTYVPVADANGADANVTTVRLRPKGTMAAGTTLAFRLRYRIK